MTGDNDLRTKLETLVEEFGQQSAKYNVLMNSSDGEAWYDYFSGLHTAYEVTFLRLRALLAEDSDPSAADG